MLNLQFHRFKPFIWKVLCLFMTYVNMEINAVMARYDPPYGVLLEVLQTLCHQI